MRISVLGASGRSGSAVVRRAQEAGHEVTAVVREEGRLDEDLHPEHVVAGRTWDATLLTRAVSGADAVAFCIGPVPGGPRTVQQDLMALTLAALRETGTRRLVAISASGGVVDGDDPLSRYLAKPIISRLLRHAFADMAEMESRIRASDRDWTVLRPPRLLDGPGRGRYRSRRDGNVRWSYSIARSDLALAVLDALADAATIGATISVAAGTPDPVAGRRR